MKRDANIAKCTGNIRTNAANALYTGRIGFARDMFQRGLKNRKEGCFNGLLRGIRI